MAREVQDRNESTERGDNNTAATTIAGRDYQARNTSELRTNENTSGAAVSEVALVNDTAPGGANETPASLRERLLANAKAHMSAEQFASFQQQLEFFEKQNGNRPQEVDSTLRQIARLVDKGEAGAVSNEHRMRLALETMRLAAVPTDAMQGDYNTCTVASLESRLFARDPAAATRMIVDMAMNGRYVSSDGRTVHAPANIAEMGDEPYNGNSLLRPSLADRLFQVTAINLFHNIQGNPLTYMQGRDAKTGMVRDILVDGNGQTIDDRGTGIKVTDMDDLTRLSNSITGKNESNFVITSANVRSPEELRRVMERLEREGNLPAVASVNLLNEPWIKRFYALPEVQWHAVTISPDPNNRGAFIMHDQQQMAYISRDSPMTGDAMSGALRYPEAVNVSPAVIGQIKGLTRQSAARDIDFQYRQLTQVSPRALAAFAQAYERDTGQSLKDKLRDLITPEQLARLQLK